MKHQRNMERYEIHIQSLQIMAVNVLIYILLCITISRQLETSIELSLIEWVVLYV